jgi:probable rRNA maturation factor
MSGSRLEIELIAEDGAEAGVDPETLVQAARQTLDRLGVEDGHVAIEIVGEFRIHQLNQGHRGKDEPTDVLSFPVDGEEIAAEGPPPLQVTGALELGDVIICPEHTENMQEAVVHGVLHLCGYDHEVDDGEMLELQDEIVSSLER